MSEAYKIHMLGDFSITRGDRSIHYGDSRSRRSWMLLAYLLFYRDRPVPREDLVRVLWENDSDLTDPLASMKTLVHRVRSLLDTLGDDAGFDLLQTKGGTYFVKPGVEIELDVDGFEDACRRLGEAVMPEEKLLCIRQAQDHYAGGFLPRFSMENWIAPLDSYYRNLYFAAVQDAVDSLLEAKDYAAVAEICRRALAIEPYHEECVFALMTALTELGDKAGVIAAYESLQELLYDNFGTVPEERCCDLYRRACSPERGEAVMPGTLLDVLNESSRAAGALECEFDVFRAVYRVAARQAARSGDVCHVAMFTVGDPERSMTESRLKNCFEQFKEVLLGGLRIGDSVAVCGPNQLVAMLPMANYENSCKVCARAVQSYRRRYPRNPAQVEYSVRSIEPVM